MSTFRTGMYTSIMCVHTQNGIANVKADSLGWQETILPDVKTALEGIWTGLHSHKKAEARGRLHTVTYVTWTAVNLSQRQTLIILYTLFNVK